MYTKIVVVCLTLFCMAKSDFNGDCVVQHNRVRSGERKPTMSLNDNLLKWSKKRANELAANCVFDHSGNANSGYGENIAADMDQCSGAVNQWMTEKDLYVRTNPVYSPEAANYTQLVWRDTRYVGCATASAGEDCKFRSIIVCNYYKPGNKDGLFNDNV